MSETEKTRHITSKFCSGNGIDLGSGGDPVVPWAIQFDATRVAHLSYNPVQWEGDIFKPLPFRERSLDFVYASHSLEDAADWEPILIEWCRVIKPGGFLIIQVPDKERFRAVVAAGQPDNLAHKHESYPGELTKYINKIGGFSVIMDRFEPENDYNILAIFKKI